MLRDPGRVRYNQKHNLASGTAFSQLTFGFGVIGGTKSGVDLTGSVLDTKLNFGGQARLVYEFSDVIEFVGGFSYFWPSEVTIGSLKTKWDLMILNTGVLFYVVSEEDFKFYGLGGGTFTAFKVTSGTNMESTSDFGWEAGAGVKIGRVFIEGKYDSNREQIIAIVGIYF